MNEQITNDTILLIVRNNGMIEPHPQLTNGAMLQIAEQIRQAVLSMPVMRPHNGKHAQPETQPIEA
jgi:hypothetical protein